MAATTARRCRAVTRLLATGTFFTPAADDLDQARQPRWLSTLERRPAAAERLGGPLPRNATSSRLLQYPRRFLRSEFPPA